MDERKRHDENSSSYLSMDQFYIREGNMKEKEDKSRETCRKNTYEFCALLSACESNRVNMSS